MKPVPTIIPESQKTVNLHSIAVLDTLKIPRKPPKVRVFHEDEYTKFKATDEISALEHITENKVKQLGEGFKIKSLLDGALIYCLEIYSEFTQITYCIKVYHSLCLKLFHKEVPIHFPFWFFVGRNLRLTDWSMVPKFVLYVKERSVETKSVLCELNSACLDQWQALSKGLPCILSKMCLITSWSTGNSYFYHLYVKICLMKYDFHGVKFLGAFCKMYMKRMQNAKLTCELLQSSQRLFFNQGIVT